jgi:hypothetical protein
VLHVRRRCRPIHGHCELTLTASVYASRVSHLTRRDSPSQGDVLVYCACFALQPLRGLKDSTHTH